MNAMAQQKGLGRGLGALLGDYNQAPEGTEPSACCPCSGWSQTRINPAGILMKRSYRP